MNCPSCRRKEASTNGFSRGHAAPYKHFNSLFFQHTHFSLHVVVINSSYNLPKARAGQHDWDERVCFGLTTVQDVVDPGDLNNLCQEGMSIPGKQT